MKQREPAEKEVKCVTCAWADKEGCPKMRYEYEHNFHYISDHAVFIATESHGPEFVDMFEVWCPHAEWLDYHWQFKSRKCDDYRIVLDYHIDSLFK